MPTETPSTLQTIAQDLNRSLFHGARKVDGEGRARPATVLTGQQSPANEASVTGGIDLLVDGQPVALLRATDVNTIFENAQRALTMPPAHAKDPRVDPLVAPGNEFFALEPDPAIPTWVYHQRALSLPTRPVPEDLIPDGDRKLLRLPGAVLREADSELPPTPNPDVAVELSLCQAVEEPVPGTQAKRTRVEAIAQADWMPALLVRSPIVFAPDKGQTPIPVFELKGIPQDERWYLDQLGLLGGDGKHRPLDPQAKVQLWLEWAALDEHDHSPILKRREVTEWVITRENLTGLARPGQNSFAPEDAAADLPFAATQVELEASVQLLQMGSITNSGGYYVRAVAVKPTDPPTALDLAELVALPKNSLWLVITISLPKPVTGGSVQKFPLCANAINFRPAAVTSDLVMRFEGPGHISLQPFAPAGTIAFGWRRPIVGKPDSFIQTAEGFARAIHLIDFEVADGIGIIDSYREALQPSGDNPPKRVWIKEACSGDTGPALSPLPSLAKELADGGGSFAQNRVAALSLEAFTGESGASPSPDDNKFWFYRTAVRYDSTSVYRRLADPTRRKLTITSGFRDVFGNRIAPKFTSQEQTLCYTDPVLPPFEWPSISYRMLPLGPRQVTFQARFLRAPQGEDADLSLRQKLMLIRDQLAGARNEVNVTIVDEDVFLGRAKEDDRFKFGVAADQQDLHTLFLALLDGALTSDTFPAKAVIKETVLDIAAPQNFGKPTLFLPALVVQRSDFLPPNIVPDGAPPADVALGASIGDQIRRAISPVPLTAIPFPSPEVPPPGPNDALLPQPEFEEIAKKFETVLALTNTPSAAIRRNRFNEHELWFVPSAAQPHSLAGEPIFSSARPLSNVRGAGEFDLPDYLRSGTPVVGQFNGFPVVRRTFPPQDFDLLGRAAFAFVDRALTPRDITSSSEVPTWKEILRLKRKIADTLGDPGQGFIVPIFTGERPSIEGQKRMVTDAFERNLSGFYGIDTIAQFHVKLPKPEAKVNNFYGTVTPTIDTASATKPTFSDFVLSVKFDAEGDGQDGILTLLYDLEPGAEDRWREYKTTKLTVNVTHLQLPVPGDAPVHEFDQGQWLKLANPLEFDLDLGSHNPLQIPAVERSFPAEPTFRACDVVRVDADRATAADLAKWKWKIQFLTEKSQADSLFLTVDYNQPEPPPASPAKPGFQEVAFAFTTVNLLHALIALEQLSRQWDTLRSAGGVDSVNALATFAFLLDRLLHHLPGGADAFEAGTTPDRFVYHTATGDIEVDSGNTRVKQLAVAPDLAPQGAFQGYTALAGDFLSLFDSDRAFNYQPSLRLKRNDHLIKIKDPVTGQGTDKWRETTPSLVYECGPAIWPTPVRVTNQWLTPIRVAPATGSLTEFLKSNLRGIFGHADLKSMAVHVLLSHVFAAGPREVVNPFLIFPVDLQFSAVDDLASEIVTRYTIWLGRAGGVPNQFFKRIPQLRLRLSLQVSEPPTDGRSAGRLWLEVGTLEFDLSLIDSLS
jgi:hypothetical protein